MGGKEKSMKRIFCTTATLCLLSLVPLTGMGQTTRFKTVQDGEFANLTQTIGPLSNFSLNVSRGLTTSSGANASLQYSAFTITTDANGNVTSIIFTNAFGPIPPSTFTGQNTQNLALSIDTSALDPTVFTSETCTLSFATFIETCGAGPAGVINLQFTENDAQSTTIHSLTEVTNGPVTTRTKQKSDTSTANVSGTVFGAAISGAAANVGVNDMTSVEVIHK
jgi:hypothetical protein